MYFFIIMFLCHTNLMINKYTSYIIVLQCWNTAARKHPTFAKQVEGQCSCVYNISEIYSLKVTISEEIKAISHNYIYIIYSTYSDVCRKSLSGGVKNTKRKVIYIQCCEIFARLVCYAALIGS